MVLRPASCTQTSPSLDSGSPLAHGIHTRCQPERPDLFAAIRWTKATPFLSLVLILLADHLTLPSSSVIFALGSTGRTTFAVEMMRVRPFLPNHTLPNDTNGRVSASRHMAWERNLRATIKTPPKKNGKSPPAKKDKLRRALRKAGMGSGNGGNGGEGEDGRPSFGTWEKTQHLLQMLKEMTGTVSGCM